MDITLYPRQVDLVRASHREVLAAGTGGGKSHALRVGAVMFCLRYPGVTVGLLHPRHDELARDHVEGRTGLKALLAQHPGTVRFEPHGVRFANGSKLAWAGADKPAEVRRLTEETPRLLFIDELPRVPRDLYEQVFVQVELAGGRVVAAAPALAEAGWVAERFENGHRDRIVIPTSAQDLPEELREVSTVPTLDDYMDGLGIPFLAPGSAFRQKPYVHKITDVLQRWFWGRFNLLFLLLPTQHGKTLLAVRVASSYIVFCRPYESVGVSTYDKTKALARSRDARDFYKAAGGLLKDGATGAAHWQTPYEGGVWAEGMEGGSGNPMAWGVIDDPDKNLRESKSETYIQRKDDWYQYVWVGREAIDTSKGQLSLAMVATRMWYDDTVGRTLRFHLERGDQVHVLVLPALYDPQVADHYEAMAPAQVTVEPDFRSEEGEPIDPERHDREHWEKTASSRPHVFWGRDQQKPEDSEAGVHFSKAWPIDIPADPAFAADSKGERATYFRPTRAYDIAHTEGGGHYTASVKIGELRAADRIVLRHASRGRYGPRNVLRMIGAQMLLDGPEVDVVLPKDPAGGAQTVDRAAQYLRDVCRRLTIDCPDCRGPRCKRCGGERSLRVRRPRFRTVRVDSMEEDFEDFASRATPISETVEGSLDYVRSEWRPVLTEAVPWFWEAVRQVDADWGAELRELEAISRRVVEENLRWWVEYFRELHLYPSSDFDDWISATSYAWQYLDKPRSIYPGATERLAPENRGGVH